MTKAAGILFLTKAGTALFLRRTATALDCAGCWDFPGGGQEGEETAEETAVREAREEVGQFPDGKLILHTITKGSTSKGVAGLGASDVGLPVQSGAPTAAAAVTPVPAPGCDYTTFLQKVGTEFTPELNDEHDGWCWTPVASPPEPLHPGCRIAIDRLTMDELGVARAIADGRLTSPQKYENVWLFAIRFTGTGAAYRDKIDEFAVRNAADHQNPDALARLNGLPVIFRHPKKALLDGDEFRNRIVGTVFLPYVAGDEVWVIAKIWVDAAAEMMSEGGLSTSPGVNFADFSVNARLTLEDGSKVLVEGKPSLVDHVAICQLGVWDKGGDPAGIRAESREDEAMAEVEKKEEEKREDAKRDDAAKKDNERDDAAKKDASKKDDDGGDEKDKDEKKADARKDADAGSALDKTLKHMLDSMTAIKDAVTGFGKRMDAIEDIEKTRKDRGRKDADEEKEKEDPKELAAQNDKAKKDAKRDDSKRDDSRADSALQDRLAAVEAAVKDTSTRLPKEVTDADYNAMADAQARADDVFTQFGKQAPRPLLGETVGAYERRCVRMLQDHSPTWKGKQVTTAFADELAFSTVRDQVYREARADAANPANVTPGQLRMVEKRRDGHIVREFYGQPRDWMDPLAGPVQLRGTGTFMTKGLGVD